MPTQPAHPNALVRSVRLGRPLQGVSMPTQPAHPNALQQGLGGTTAVVLRFNAD